MGAFIIDFKTLAALMVLVVSSFALADGVTYTYDSLGRITGATYANGAAVQYAYDANGNRTTLSITAPTLQSQTISFGTTPVVVVGGTASLSASGGASGDPLVFSSTTQNVCTVNGSTVTGVTAGTCTIAANQAGNANYNAAPQITQTFSIGKGNQTISFSSAPTVSLGGIGKVSATGGASVNPVVFTSTNTGICTVSGSTVTGIAVGTCTIAANQSGDANYNAALQATESFNVTVPLFALNISNANIPFGTVSSNGGGIACGATCSGNFASGTQVTLTAIPVSGYQFTGWGGACRGYGNSCTVTTTNAAQNVNANFAPFKVHQPLWKRAIGSIVKKGG